MEATDFSLHEIVDSVLSLFRLDAQSRGLALLSNISSDVPDWLIGDPTRLQQIISNLVGNALKFTRDGSVIIGCAISRTDKRKDGEPFRLPEAFKSDDGSNKEFPNVVLHFFVEDTGIGIEPETAEMIFSPFSQADNSYTRKHGGAGLGLSICMRLVKMMGGEIWVDNNAGKGSTFNFTVCLAKSNEETELTVGQHELDTNSSHNTYHILLAEDEPVNREIARKTLSKEGHHVVVACNGKEALKELETGQCDCIIMDLQMPEMDGLTATKHIRKKEKDKSHIPIIALTAHALKGDKEKCINAGMDAYFSKPFIKKELFSMIENLVEKQRLFEG